MAILFCYFPQLWYLIDNQMNEHNSTRSLRAYLINTRVIVLIGSVPASALAFRRDAEARNWIMHISNILTASDLSLDRSNPASSTFVV